MQVQHGGRWHEGGIGSVRGVRVLHLSVREESVRQPPHCPLPPSHPTPPACLPACLLPPLAPQEKKAQTQAEEKEVMVCAGVQVVFE